MKPYLPLAAVLALAPFVQASAAALSAQDKTFIRQAAIGGLAEIHEGQMAVSMAQSADVKQFGQKMIDDHTANNNELMALAQQKGITPPAALDSRHKTEAATLQKQSGAAFDRTYLKDQIAGHKQMEAVMQKEIRSGSDPDLKAFAQKTLPVVQEHLQMAQQLPTNS